MTHSGKVNVKLVAGVVVLAAVLGVAIVRSYLRSQNLHVRATAWLKQFGTNMELYESKYHAEPADLDSLKRAGKELLKDEFGYIRPCPECGQGLTCNIPGFGTGKVTDPASVPADWPVAWHDCPSRSGDKVEVLYPQGRVEDVDRASFSEKVTEKTKSGEYKLWEPPR